jgi:peroxiredoxin Q/BCP
MIDPLKATKGRRMPKKTRKKSPKKSSKTSPAKAARARSGAAARTAAKTVAKKVTKAKTKVTAKAKAKTKAIAQKPVPKSAPAGAKKLAKTATGAASKTSQNKRATSGAKPSVVPVAAKPTVTSKVKHKVTSKAAATNPDPAKLTSGKVLEAKAEAPGTAPSALAEGSKAPAFRLPRDGGDTVSLADYAGKKLVLFFYPRADTPGCTKEAIDFTRLASAFAESGTAVLGVSADPLKAQESFRDKHGLSIPLVSDEKHEMLNAYGVWGEKSMYGKVFQGVLRTTVLIDGDGRLARIWRHVKVDGHADEVLEAARTA